MTKKIKTKLPQHWLVAIAFCAGVGMGAGGVAITTQTKPHASQAVAAGEANNWYTTRPSWTSLLRGWFGAKRAPNESSDPGDRPWFAQKSK